jgi:hypothetical protein
VGRNDKKGEIMPPWWQLWAELVAQALIRRWLTEPDRHQQGATEVTVDCNTQVDEAAEKGEQHSGGHAELQSDCSSEGGPNWHIR